MRRVLVLFVAVGVVPLPSTAQSPRRVDRTAYAQARDSAYALPVNRSAIAFVLPEKDLLAENVAHDPRSGAFFVGSTRHGKVVRRTRDGRVSDFIPTGRDGMWMVIGMKVDTARRALWVNSSAGGNYTGHREADAGKAGIFRYDLATGRLRARLIPTDTGRHFFNDLVITPDGSVYATNMTAGAIYRVDRSGERLSVWLRPEKLTDPNGIALSGDGRTLYVASREGINAIDIASRRHTLLAVADSVDVVGIDGLYWMNGALVAIQGGRRNRVQRFTLSGDGTRITAGHVVEANHPMFMNPTTGVVVGDELYYVANSQFDSFTADGRLFPPERLFETVILRAKP